MVQRSAPPWFWRLDRTWHDGRLAVPAWVVTTMLALVAVYAASLGWRHQVSALREAEAAAEIARRVANSVVKPPALPLAVAQDFTEALAPLPSSSDLAQQISRAAGEAGAQVSALQFGLVPATPQTLARLDVSLQMRGPYPAIKRVLKELQDRHAGLTLQSLQLRKGGSAAETQAQITLVLWSRAKVQP